MNDETWQRLKELFGEAKMLPGDEREAFLQRECASDDDLLERVRSLLNAHEQADEFLREPTFGEDGDATSNAAVAEPGATIGPYKLLERIGEGGFGVVHMAEQQSPLVRRVALKIIKPGMDTKQVIARFEAERQALAMMDHPNIARVYDAGATPEGRPYFVMELVKGVPITQYCDDHSLSISERLELFAAACEAVQHAHQKGIIHRDLKPSNVLVMMRDEMPIVKVIDFGIAKATSRSGGARLTDKTLFTEFHQLIGTPQYMSPEQAANELDIDTRSDVYSLGVLLYELLTGTTPFDPQRLRSAAFGEIQRIVREEEPPKPSTRLSGMSLSSSLEEGGNGVSGASDETPSTQLPDPSVRGRVSIDATTIARRRRTDPTTLSRTIRGDLDWIVMKTLEKDRTRRYGTATDLAADVRRYLHHEPVTAGPPSRAYRVRKFVRRNRPAVMATSLIALALVLGVIGTSVALAWALREAERAHLAEAAERERADELEKVAAFQASQLSEIDPSMMGIRLRRNILDKRRAFMESREADEDEIESSLRELDRHLGGVNFTNVALDALDESIFERALAAIEEQFADQPLLKARLLQTLAVTMLELGMPASAAAPQSEALAIRQAVLGAEHPLALNSLHAQGTLMRMTARFDDALAILREAVDGARRVLGDDHPDTLDSMNTLGVVLVAMGRYDEAEQCYREVLTARRRVLGDRHPDTILTMGNMGSLFANQGRFADAEAYLRDALEGSRHHFGDDHYRTLVFQWHLGQVLLVQQKLADSEIYIRSAVDGKRRVLGDDHPITLLAIGTLARLLVEQSEFGDAESCFREAIIGYRRTLGDEHPSTLRSIGNLGMLRWRQEEFADAESYFREALDGLRRVVDVAHPDTLEAMSRLGLVLQQKGEFTDAEQLLLESYNVLRNDRGPTFIDTLSAHRRIITLYDAWHEAEPGGGYDEKARTWEALMPEDRK